MRFGTPWRLAVLASVTLLTSSQLCMLTTCVPRLTRSHGAAAQECCRTTPAAETPPSPMPAGAMPCDQQLSLADAPTLGAPQPLVTPVAFELDVAPSLAAPIRVAGEERDLDTGPAPGVHRSAPSGLRAPPRA